VDRSLKVFLHGGFLRPYSIRAACTKTLIDPFSARLNNCIANLTGVVTLSLHAVEWPSGLASETFVNPEKDT
jgi:hypothetical protein